MLEQSILTSVKAMMQMPEEYDDFDMELSLHINSAFSTLNQLGVGPEKPFSIEDSTAKWGDFIGDNEKIQSVKSYVYISVKIIFDPPQNSGTMEAFQERKRELEFRLNVASDKVVQPWQSPSV